MTEAVAEKTKTEEKKQPKNTGKMAYVENIFLHDFVEAALLDKAIPEGALNEYLSTGSKPKNIIELVDALRTIEPYIEEDILVKVFHEKYGYELQVDTSHHIPAILKWMFNPQKPSEDKFFKRWDAENILSMDLVTIDISADTLTILMRTPEIPKSFREKIAPLMKSKWLKNIKVKLTTKDIFDYYKENLTYNVINSVL